MSFFHGFESHHTYMDLEVIIISLNKPRMTYTQSIRNSDYVRISRITDTKSFRDIIFYMKRKQFTPILIIDNKLFTLYICLEFTIKVI